MTFTSIPFLLLFCFTYLLIRNTKDCRKKHIILLTASYLFYAYWDIRFLFLMLLEEYVCFYLARKCSDTHKKYYLCAGIVFSLGILGFFKYFNFFCESFSAIFHIENMRTLNIILPVGISFYTFQSLSYLIDVYRGTINANNSFLKVSLYISFFPQLVAGPIVRASDFLCQLDENKELTRENFQKGIQIFVFGVAKKALIADRLAVCVDAVFAAPMAYDTLAIWCAVISYTIQIYCDFSGYSDMAIGIARIFGYELCPNFNLPYLSKNPTEFWKRWHISLSKWLQDYLYIPLGGNRQGILRTYFNLFITMLLGGLWHGASWNFILWGGLHGTALITHKILSKQYTPSIHTPHSENVHAHKIVEIISIITNNLFIMICWVFFRTSTVKDACVILRRMFSACDGIHYVYTYTIFWGILLLALHIYLKIRNAGNGKYPLLNLEKMSGQILFFSMIWIILAFGYSGDTAFIYFQF